MKRHCEECERLQKIAYLINKAFAEEGNREINLNELETYVCNTHDNFSSEELLMYIKRAKHLELKEGKVIMEEWWFEKIMEVFR